MSNTLHKRFTFLLSFIVLIPLGVEGQGHEFYRKKMVELIENRGITDQRILQAMLTIPRHKFVPDQFKDQAYDDHALPIEESQTISQPYIVAYMTNALELETSDRILEIGTGSGYQAAVLAEIVHSVYTIEIIPELSIQAQSVLEGLSYENIKFLIGDGYRGWPEHAPFDGIIVTAAPPRVPKALKEQLAVGGKMIIPVGARNNVQSLQLVEKIAPDRFRTKELLPVRFVPMVEENN